jgi:uncharacterized protein YndB with AHSA1/START domain
MTCSSRQGMHACLLDQEVAVCQRSEPIAEATGYPSPMAQDIVTGASVEVSVEVPGTPPQIWDLVTDVTRIGEWSPECVDAWWSDTEHESAAIGARFEGHNRYPGGFEATSQCVVTEASRPDTFTWVVLDSDELVDRPGSTWSYQLAPSGPDTTMVTHRFVHGPGMTGVRSGADSDPENAQQMTDERWALLRKNMTLTIEAIGRSVS